MNHENYNSFYQFYDLCMFQKLVILKIRLMIVWIFLGQIIYFNIFSQNWIIHLFFMCGQNWGFYISCSNPEAAVVQWFEIT